MITNIASEQLKSILEYLPRDDLQAIQQNVVPYALVTVTKEEMINAILSSACCPSQVLRQRPVRKSILLDYFWQVGIAVTPEHSKSDYIRMLLGLWQVDDDDCLWDFLADEEIEDELNRMEENMRGSIQDLKLRIRENRPSASELGNMKRAVDEFLKTADSIGIHAGHSTPSNEARKIPKRPSSDDDYDSSSSGYSVEIIEELPIAENTSSQAESLEDKYKVIPLSSEAPVALFLIGSTSYELKHPSETSEHDPSGNRPSHSTGNAEYVSSQAETSNKKSKISISKEELSPPEEPVALCLVTNSSLEQQLPMDTTELRTSGSRACHSTPNPALSVYEARFASKSVGSSSSRSSFLRDTESVLARAGPLHAKEIIRTLFKNYFGKEL